MNTIQDRIKRQERINNVLLLVMMVVIITTGVMFIRHEARTLTDQEKIDYYVMQSQNECERYRSGFERENCYNYYGGLIDGINLK
jgi:cell division protein FtsL